MRARFRAARSLVTHPSWPIFTRPGKGLHRLCGKGCGNHPFWRAKPAWTLGSMVLHRSSCSMYHQSNIDIHTRTQERCGLDGKARFPQFPLSFALTPKNHLHHKAEESKTHTGRGSDPQNRSEGAPFPGFRHTAVTWAQKQGKRGPKLELRRAVRPLSTARSPVSSNLALLASRHTACPRPSSSASGA